MIVLITIINLFNYLDRYLVASLLPHLSDSFSLNHAESGFLVSSFVFGYIVASPVAGVISHRWNNALFAFGGVIIFALSTILCAYATSYEIFILARIGIGVGEGMFSTIVPTLINAKVSSPRELNRALALFFSAIPVGAALGYLLGGIAGAHLGWQAAFVIAGLGSIISGVALLHPYWRNAGIAFERNAISVLGVIKYTWQNHLVRYAIIGYAFHTFSLQSIAAFVSTYCSSVLQMDADHASFIFGIILVCTGFGGTWIGGVVSSSYVERYGPSGELRFISRCAYISAFLVALVFVVPANVFFYVAALAELGAFLTVAPINAALLSNAAPQFKTGVQGVTILVINALGSLVGPVLVGYLADYFTLALALQTAALSMLVAGVFWTKSYRL